MANKSPLKMTTKACKVFLKKNNHTEGAKVYDTEAKIIYTYRDGAWLVNPVMTQAEKASYDVVVTEAVRSTGVTLQDGRAVTLEHPENLTTISDIFYGNDSSMGFGGIPDANLILDLKPSINKAFGIPAMITSQRTGITPMPRSGSQVFDTTLQSLFISDGTTWHNLSSKDIRMNTAARLAIVNPIDGRQVLDTDYNTLFTRIVDRWCVGLSPFISTSTDALPPPEANEWADDGNGYAANTYRGGVYTAFQDLIFDTMTFHMEQESNPDVNILVYQDFPKTGVFKLMGRKIDESITSTGSFKITIIPEGTETKIHIYQGQRFIVLFGRGSNQNDYTLKAFKANTVKGVNQNPVESPMVPSNFTTNINSTGGVTPATIDFRMSGGNVTPANGLETSPICWVGNDTFAVVRKHNLLSLAKAVSDGKNEKYLTIKQEVVDKIKKELSDKKISSEDLNLDEENLDIELKKQLKLLKDIK